MLLLDSKRLIVSHINKTNGTQYKYEDAVFGKPYAIADMPAGTATYGNTSVRVRFGIKEYVYTYNRVDFTGSFMQFPYQTKSLLKMQSVTNDLSASVAKAISTHYGFPMEAEDVEQGTVLIANDQLYFNISAKSYRYLPARVALPLRGMHHYDGSDVYAIHEPVNMQPDWWYDNNKYHMAANYEAAPKIDFVTTGLDYSPVARQLRTFIGEPDFTKVTASGANQTARLGMLLNSVDGLPYNTAGGAFNVGGDVSLADVWIVYNGPTSQCKKLNAMIQRMPAEQVRMLAPVNEQYDNVLLVRIGRDTNAGGTKSTTLSTIVAHYNLG